MRTGRSLTVCCSLLPGDGGRKGSQPGPGGGVSARSWGGVSAWSRGGVSAWSWGGSAWSQGRGFPWWGGVCLVPGGFSLVPGGFSLVGGVCLVPGGVCLVLWGGSAWSQGGGGSPWRGVCLVLGGGPCPETPPVNRITHTCKNITLATTSLRPVKNTLLRAKGHTALPYLYPKTHDSERIILTYPWDSLHWYANNRI